MSDVQDEAGEMFRIAQTLHKQGDLTNAQRIYEEVLARDPDHADTLHNLGLISIQSGRHAEALPPLAAAIQQRPESPFAYFNRGGALIALDRAEEALADLDRAVALRPDFIEALVRRADALRVLGRTPEALAAYGRALEVRPGHGPAHAGRGETLDALGRPAEALADYERALGRVPDAAVLHYNRGNALKQLGRVGEAVAAYGEALALKPDFAVARHNRGVCLMLQGRIEEGLRAYEARKQTPDFTPDAAFPRPAWSGEQSLVGKTLFIRPELFLGDMIQFSRYAALAADLGGRVVLAAPVQLHALLGGLHRGVELIAANAVPEAYDHHCALMSLPLAFKTGFATIPARVPYLAAEPARAARWKARIGDRGFKVGVCWRGSAAPHAAAMGRDFPLAALADLARAPGVRLISLQKHDGLEELARLPDGMTVDTLGDDFDSGPDAFLDTAAVIASCDLVVSADTAVAHVAGALGARTWLALPQVPDWRWFLGRDDSPWYPTLRLFRQQTRGDWTPVFARMAAALATELAGETHA